MHDSSAHRSSPALAAACVALLASPRVRSTLAAGWSPLASCTRRSHARSSAAGVPRSGRRPSASAPCLAIDAVGPARSSSITSAALPRLPRCYSVRYLRDGARTTRHGGAAPLRRPALLWFLAAMTLVAATPAPRPPVGRRSRRRPSRARRSSASTERRGARGDVEVPAHLLGRHRARAARAPSSSASRPGAAARRRRSSCRRCSRRAPRCSPRPGSRPPSSSRSSATARRWASRRCTPGCPTRTARRPSPVSALLSGALLNCALPRHPPLLPGRALAAGDAGVRADAAPRCFGFVSLGVAAAFIVGQRDYKRLLAYSSVEHMGIIAVGVGLGGAATYGALLPRAQPLALQGGRSSSAPATCSRAYGTTDMRRGARRPRARLPVTGALLVAASSPSSARRRSAPS